MGRSSSNPRQNFQLLPAAIVDAFEDRHDIIFGQKGSAGTSVEDALNVNVEAMTTAEIKVLFGATSFMTEQILQWKATNEGKSPLDAVSMDPAGGATAATGVITFVGTATSAGEYKISIVDEEKYQVTVDIPDTSTETQAALAVKTALDLLTDAVFTSGVAAGVYTATATDVGTVGNFYGIKIEGVVPGMVPTITPWTGGATDPTLTTILDNIEGIRYTGAMWPENWNSSLSIIKTEFESRFNADNAILDGTIFHGYTDTYANLLVKIATENSKTVVYMGTNKLADTTQHTGPAILKPADWVAAEFAGIRARRLTPGAGIADYIITTSGGLDAFGGPSLASLPYFNTPLRNTPVTSTANLFSSDEQKALEDAGFTTYGVNDSQNAMIMNPVVTNWTEDAGGNANVSFHYLNYTDTGSVSREIFFRVFKSVYAQSRLTEGDLIAGRSMANAESIKAELLRINGVLADAALTQKGRQAQSFFNLNTIVTVVLADRGATITGPLPIVTQLGNINYALQLSFTTGSSATQITV